MFQPTLPLGRALRRLALTTKQGPKDYYKGTGSGSMGQHTKFGGYQINYSKVRTYVPPNYENEDLKQLTPFVSARLPRPARERLIDAATGEVIKDPRIGGRLFLRRWKKMTVQEGYPEEEVEEAGADQEESTEKSV
ncbi:hypothetical protein Vi05172_g10909 [Venturia inaequalis]|uniref:50S ribosomal protein YmL27 n=1 Tax=Venturia inaequalis TaxID=5025 RepID=A0A8H3VUN0_VENIN|nr:hypothetical protein EG327_002530 [Venturia inaequalis]RDI79044.1 hypothetical protein Vi05172_g10909 [Venturia inaequalis]